MQTSSPSSVATSNDCERLVLNFPNARLSQCAAILFQHLCLFCLGLHQLPRRTRWTSTCLCMEANP
jgi:hypothetical protein